MKTFIPNLSGKALKRLGVTLMIGTSPFVLIGFWAIGKLDEMAKLRDPGFANLLGLVGVGLLSYFLYRTGQDWYKQGKHLSAPSAESLMSKDPRPPVLYLRSFQDDPIAAQGKYIGAHLGLKALRSL